MNIHIPSSTWRTLATIVKSKEMHMTITFCNKKHFYHQVEHTHYVHSIIVKCRLYFSSNFQHVRLFALAWATFVELCNHSPSYPTYPIAKNGHILTKLGHVPALSNQKRLWRSLVHKSHIYCTSPSTFNTIDGPRQPLVR